MKNKSDDIIFQSEICAKASQISLIAEQNRSIPSENSEILLASSAKCFGREENNA